METLQALVESQRQLQLESFGGVDPAGHEGDARADFIRWNVLALEDELHEALAETGWKPWATSRHLNRVAYLGELVDAFHFFMNLCIVAGITGEEIAQGYYAKRAVNVKRQEDGYDGVTGKDETGRATDEPCMQHFGGSYCTKTGPHETHVNQYHQQWTLTDTVAAGRAYPARRKIGDLVEQWNTTTNQWESV